ncbi:HU family DNA-binding protein [Paenibacillus sp. JSM ZJ436]|uniref:HU family DNA-binding protein n=1 Tax=Paenibacillus sp. JSM ZJ436 TaxID=3376190 RepID=UPI0037940BE0
MNKKELIVAVAAQTDFNKKDVEAVVDAVFGQITSALVNGDEVNIPGFGKYTVKEKAARTARNPHSGEPVDVPAKKAPAFKFAKATKDAVNGQGE